MSRSSQGPTSLRVANLVIAGVSKGGTTSLFSYLAQHPDVCASDVKEVRYFTPLRYGEPLEPVETYAQHFRHCAGERYTLEATPGYLYGGRPLAQGILRASPDVRVIVSLRAPADRCWSWFNFVRSRARVPKDLPFQDYLQRCLQLHAEGLDGAVEHQAYWGLGGGCYDQWVQDWLDELGDRLRIVFFDDVVGQPAQLVAGLCDWLGIDNDCVLDMDFSTENRTEQFRNKPAQQIALSLNRRTENFFRQHRGLKRALRGVYYSVNGDPSKGSLAAESRSLMDDFYAPHLAALAAQLVAAGRADLPDWLRVLDRPAATAAEVAEPGTS
jgi:hypothetical protein